MASLYEMANDWSVRELKREYSRLRDQFQKQIGRLAKVDTSARIQAFTKGGYKFQRTVKEIENLRGRKKWSEKAIREDWARRVSELKGLTEARSLSLSGRKQIRRDIIQSLQNQGYSIDNKNFDTFTSLMNYFKDNEELDMYGSGTILEAFENWINGGVLQDQELQAHIKEWEKWKKEHESADLFN